MHRAEREGELGSEPSPGGDGPLRQSWKNPGRYYLNRWPSARAMASIRANIRDRTHRHYAATGLDVVVGSLNPVLRGWGAYCPAQLLHDRTDALTGDTAWSSRAITLMGKVGHGDGSSFSATTRRQ